MKKERIIVSILLSIVGILTLIDTLEDISEGAKIGHLTLELIMIFASFFTIFFLIFKIAQEKRISKKLAEEKVVLREIAERYQKKSEVFINGLSITIDKYFNDWKLSAAERDIALFLLKGLSPKKISDYRSTSEKTVRHQINSIYKKSSINGREEFTAYFLEDLLPSAGQP